MVNLGTNRVENAHNDPALRRVRDARRVEALQPGGAQQLQVAVDNRMRIERRLLDQVLGLDTTATPRHQTSEGMIECVWGDRGVTLALTKIRIALVAP